jgi:hypothetical protein
MSALAPGQLSLLALRAVSDNDVSPGVIGFVVVASLGVATWLLIRSMNRQIKKIDLPDDEPPAGQDQPDGTSREERGSADG